MSRELYEAGEALFFLIYFGPILVPITFLVYAVVRKTFSLQFLFLAITSEAAALAAHLWLREQMP